MKYLKCQTENPEGLKFYEECGVDGRVTKAEKHLAALL
jgi:hypothetical protein